MNRDLVDTIQDDKLAIQNSRQSNLTLKRIDKKPVEFLEFFLVQIFTTDPGLK